LEFLDEELIEPIYAIMYQLTAEFSLEAVAPDEQMDKKAAAITVTGSATSLFFIILHLEERLFEQDLELGYV
jgi:hypothetical protein